MPDNNIVNLPFTPGDNVGKPIAPPDLTEGSRENENQGIANFEANLARLRQPEAFKPVYGVPTDNRYPAYFPDRNNENMYAQSQGGWDRMGNAAVNFVSKVGSYLTQSAGFIGGAVPAVIGGAVNIVDKAAGGDGKVIQNGNAISLMTDNFLDKFADAWKDKTQEEFPIYKTDKYTNGNIWQKLGTTSWWLDDAIDRAALTAATLVPGFLEAKGLGLFGSAVKGGVLEATGMGAKAIKTIAENPELYGKLGTAASKAIYGVVTDGTVDLVGSAALNFKKITQGAQYAELMAFNTIGQNALNGRESQVAIRKALQEQNEKGLTNYTPEEIENKAAEGAMKGFWYNMPLTLASSAFELPQVFSSMKGAQNLLKELGPVNSFEEIESGLAALAAKTSKPTVGSVIRKSLITGFEHGQLESSQVAIGRAIEDAIAGKIVNGKVEKEDNIWNASIRDYLGNFSDANGQNNIALGTIQGVLTTLFGHAFKIKNGEYKAQDVAKQNLVDVINQGIASRRFFSAPDHFVEKENGMAKLNPDGSPVFNQQKLAQAGLSLIDANIRYNQKIEAIKTGNKKALEEMNFDSLSFLAHDFFTDAGGVEYLHNVLKFEAAHQNTLPERANDNENGIELTPTVQLARNLQYVDTLYKAYNAIEQRHAGFLNIDINHKDKAEEQLAAAFVDGHKAAQYMTAAKQIFLNDKINRNLSEAASLGYVEKVQDPSTPMEDRANELHAQNEQLQKELSGYKDLYKELIDRKEVDKAWEAKKAQYKKDAEFVENVKEKANKTEDIPHEVVPDTINTADGEKPVEFGKPYSSADEPLSREGDTLSLLPSFTINKKNEDGTFEVNLPNGTQILSKDDFKDIKLNDLPGTEEKVKQTVSDSIDEVLSRDKYKDIPAPQGEVEDKIKYINSLNNKELVDAIEEKVNKENQIFQESLKAQKEELSNINKDEKVKKVILGSLEKGGLNNSPEEQGEPYVFEPSSKKGANIMFAATRAFSPGFSKGEEQPHHKRANYFGAVFPMLANKEAYKMMLITKNSGELYGPIVDLQKGDYSPKNEDEEIILAVAVKQLKDGSYSYVNEHGEELSSINEHIDPNQVVFQPLPRAALNWSDGGSAVRSTEEVETATKNLETYRKQRAEFLAQKAPSTFLSFTPSFGIVKEQFKTQEPQPVTNVVTQKQIDTQALVKVSTTSDETISSGFNTVKLPMGRPALLLDNGVVALKNKTLSPDKANAVYEAVLALSNFAKDGTIQNNATANNLFTFLRGVVYWGIPKNLEANNAIWFADGMLHIGKQKYAFTPSTLKQSKEEVLKSLSSIYSNVNASYLKDSSPFYEVTGVKEDGSVEQKRWDSYQQYLLTPREDSPVYTTVPPVTQDGQQTRTGVYFVMEALEEKYEKPAPKPATKKAEMTIGKEMSFEELAKAVATAPSTTNIASPKTDEAVIQSPTTAVKEGELNDAAKWLIALSEQAPPRNTSNKTRIVTEKDVTPEDWGKLQKFIEKNLPGVPVFRVKNLLQVGMNTQAWGYYADGAIYLYQNAEIGTGYHEVFHAVMDHFASLEEKQDILKEFQSKKGTFTPRGTSTPIEYSKATYKQVEEHLAEQLRENVLSSTPSTLLGKIGQFLKEIYSFIKGLFVNKRAIDTMFDNIKGGKYAGYVTSLSGLSYANKGIIDVDYISSKDFENIEMREKFNSQEEYDLLQHMTSQAFDYLFHETGSIFAIPKGTQADKFYETIYRYTISTLVSTPFSKVQQALKEGKINQKEHDNEVIKLQDLAKKIQDNWTLLEERHKIAMQAFGIKFDDNEELINTDENKSGRETGQDAMKIDHIKKSNFAIKLLFSTLKETTFDTPDYTQVLQPTVTLPSSVGGDKLASFGQTFVQTLNNLSDSPSFDKMIDSLVEQAKVNPNFVRLFSRLKGSRLDGKIQWDKLSLDDTSLLIAFFHSFSKQAPVVINHYIGEDGGGYIGSGNIAGMSRQLSDEYEQAIISNVKRNKDLFTPTQKQTGVKDGKPVFTKGWTVNKAELRKFNFVSDQGKLAFLKSLGIDIKYNILSRQDKAIVKDAIQGIYTAMQNTNLIATINGKTFGIMGRLSSIADTQARLTQVGSDSVYTNINNELQQTFVEKNQLSRFSEMMNSVKNKAELASTNFKYLLTDVFSKNSKVLQNLFDEEGNKIGKITTGYAAGTIDDSKNKRTTTDRLGRGARLLQQINMLTNGWYYSLVPADSSTEWMMNMGEFASLKDIQNNNFQPVYSLFKGYLEDEVALAKEKRTQSLAVQRNGRNAELRFFKDILGDKLSSILVKAEDFSVAYNENREDIESKMGKWLSDRAQEIKDELVNYQLITRNLQGGISFTGLDNSKLSSLKDVQNLSDESVDHIVKYLAINYAAANIEYHKLIFGDPYEYTDAVKRFKTFLSPAETTLYSSPEINAKLTEKYNEGLSPTDIGYRAFSEYVNTVALQDVEVMASLYKDSFVEPDAQGIILDDSNREFGIKSSNWTPEAEEQYQYDKAWERNQKAGKNEDFPVETPIPYENKELEKRDEKLLEKGNPEASDAYYVRKPVVRGPKYNGDINAPIIDKYSLSPISYRLLLQTFPNSNMLRLYNKMQAEKIDYAVFESGRKVGNEYSNIPYGEDGLISTEPFKGVVPIGYENFSVQVQTSPKENRKQTLGSQLTKLATIDLMENGVPIDYKGKDWETETDKEKASPLYKQIVHNQHLLEQMLIDGYNTLLTKLGIEDSGTTYTVKDRQKAAETIKSEILKREVNDNIIKALDYFAKGELALEATPIYQQFKNILYSIVDKNILSPKVSGGSLVQAASTFYEDKRIKHSVIKGKDVYTSTDLKFYEDEDGKRHIEVYLPVWFKNKLSPELREMSNEELYKLVEGTDVIEGIGFRIPSQAANSSDVINVKGFIPVEMGDTVIVPSALVKKVGSDFDIDKLSTYLKNIYVTSKNEIKTIPYFGTGQEAKTKIAKWLVDNELEDFTSNKKDANAIDNLSEEDDEKDRAEIDKIYTASLQNEYYNSLRGLLSAPENFQRLTSPNDAKVLKDLAAEIVSLKGGESAQNTTSSLLSMSFMSKMRHNFVVGKQLVGIAVAGQLNHSLNQRTKIYVDINKLSSIPKEMKEFLGDGRVLLPHNTTTIGNNKYASLSATKTQNGKYISDINSMITDGAVDIAKGAWIIDLLNTPATAGTFLFLNKIGVPEDIIAYFINQPIIEDYLAMLDSNGYSWLFIDSFVEDLNKGKYATETPVPQRLYNGNQESFKKYLRDTISKNAKGTSLTAQDKAYQQLVLSEFLKYAKLAEHLFYVTRGTNFDTANYNDPYLEYKKQAQLQKANNTIISSAQKILDNSFMGTNHEYWTKSRDAVATLLPTESPRIRGIIQSVLRNYVDLPDRAFVSVSRKVVQSFFDFALQNYYRLNNRIQDLMLDEDGNLPNRLRQAIANIPEYSDMRKNPVISSIVTLEAQKDDKTNNLKLRSKNAEIYEQNTIISAFREIKNNPELSKYYPDIVRVSLLQGLANSPISFTQYLPVEDVAQALQPIIDRLATTTSLENFATFHMFERNNWNNPDVVPSYKIWKKNELGVLQAYAKLGNKVKNIREMGGDVIAVDALNRVSNTDIINVSYKRPEYSKKQVEEMRKAGDFSYLYKGLYQKVYSSNGSELSKSYTTKDGRVGRTLYYKAINALGDSFRLQEYYNTPQQSIVDNGYEKIDNELPDSTIEELITGKKQKQVIPISPKEGTEGKSKC